MKTNSLPRYANKEEIDLAYQVALKLLDDLFNDPMPFFEDSSLKPTGLDKKAIADIVRDFDKWDEKISGQYSKLLACSKVLEENKLFAYAELGENGAWSETKLGAWVFLVAEWSKRFRIVLHSVDGDLSKLRISDLDRGSLKQIRTERRLFPLEFARMLKLQEEIKREYSRFLRDLPLLPGKEAPPPSATRKGIGGRPRKGIKKESNRELLISILLKHHRYNLPDKDLNTDPISTEDACKQLGWSKSVLSKAWPAIKEGLTYRNYELICGNYRSLKIFLKAIDSKEGYIERTNNEDAIGYAED